MDLDLDAIDAAAKAATPGPWFRLHDGPPTVQADETGPEKPDGSRDFLAVPGNRECNCAQVFIEQGPVAYCAVGPDCGPGPEQQMKNALHIAKAYPQVVIELVRRARLLEQMTNHYSRLPEAMR